MAACLPMHQAHPEGARGFGWKPHGTVFCSGSRHWRPLNGHAIREAAGSRNAAPLEGAVPIPPIGDDATPGGAPDLAKEETAAIGRAPIVDSLTLVMDAMH